MATLQSVDNPFDLGAGSVPDHLEGREQEQTLLKRALTSLCGQREKCFGPLRGRPPPTLTIIGPRGVGKTTLLAWIQNEAKSQEVDVVRLASLRNGNSGSTFSGFLSELASIPGLGWRQLAFQVCKYIQMALDWLPGQSLSRKFDRILKMRLRFRPLLLLLDEVIHYDAEVLSQVLQQSQILTSERWPLALVIAGSPALEVHLDNMNAAFIDRAKNIYINCLEPAATRAALSKPFADRGVKVMDEALELMMSWTGNNPYFIQIVGNEVWEAKNFADCSEVDLVLMQRAEQAVQEQRNGFYRKIYRRIRNAKLLEHASKVVAAIEAAPEPMKPEQVCTCIAEGTDLDADGALDVYNKLLYAGLYWEFSDDRVHEATPSFFNYFKEEYEQGRS